MEACNAQEFTTVCGYYTQNCPLGVCGDYYSNGCYACNDSKVSYYITGDCPNSVISYACTDDQKTCDSMIYPGGSSVYEPVCGYAKSSSGAYTNKTFSNACKSCTASGYTFFQDGVCQKDRVTCSTSSRSASCTGKASSPVCAFWTDEYGYDIFGTADNSCQACKDKSVKYYIAGSCGLNSDKNNRCLPNNRPTSCPTTKNQVCGFYLGPNGETKHKIIDNACLACKDRNILYTTPGPCNFTCDRTGNTVYECDGSSVQPICGTYVKNGKTTKVSLKNNCIGCYDVPFDITSYVDGLCPGDDGILCANDGGSGYDSSRFSAVCGVTKSGCTSASCRKSYGDPVSACQAKGVLKYLPGLCPGDEGVSCDAFRGNQGSAVDYETVCGYTQKGCKSSSCRKTYDDQVSACAKKTVLFFTSGACPK